MAAALARVLEPETLDHLAADDPRAVRSRRDLARINRIMGAPRLLRRAIERACPDWGRRPLRVVELGCGDGALLLEVARRSPKGAAPVELALLDRQPIVATETIAAYAAAGWQARSLQADVLDWARAGSDAVDLVVANLFLHHLDATGLRTLFDAVARRGAALVAVEPRRSRVALVFAHLVVFVGANDVTRRDAVLSVRAGFRDRELTALWPHGGGRDGLDERDEGPFSHVLTARAAA